MIALLNTAFIFFSGLTLLPLLTSALRTVRHNQSYRSNGLPSRARRDFDLIMERMGDGKAAQLDHVEGTKPTVVVGIALAPQRYDDRTVHRETWFTTPLVCRGDFGTPSGCLILPKFILENGSMPPETDPLFARLREEEEKHHDIAFVPGVLADKTRQWLAFAAKQYPAAKYIAKMDSDTYLSPATLIGDLMRNEKSYPVIDYYGYFLDGGTGGFTPEDHCDPATECCNPPSECWVEDGFSGNCWVYAQGGFYLVSQTVAKHVGKLLHEKHPSAMNYDCEDSILGKWIQSAPSKNGIIGRGTNRCTCGCLFSEELAWYHLYYNQNWYFEEDDRCN